MRPWLHPVVTAIALVIAAGLFLEWRSERQDRDRLQSQLDQAAQSLRKATASQDERDKQLTDSLAKLNELKDTVRTQKQILAQLPSLLPLPKPIQPAMSSINPASTSSQNEIAGKAFSEAPVKNGVILPSEDLKPLYDYALDCKACQSKLTVVTADLADEKTKTQTLSRERDAALKLANGGSLRQRVGRAMRWFLIGAVAGAVAAKH